MNEQHRTTAPAVAPDYEKAFDALEGPIASIASRAKSVDWLVGHMLDAHEDQRGNRSYCSAQMDALFHLADDLRTAAIACDELYSRMGAEFDAKAEAVEHARKTSVPFMGNVR